MRLKAHPTWLFYIYEVNMPISEWFNEIALGSGLIGSFTGIAGAIVSYKSYKKVNQIKVLDLRIELKRSIADALSDFNKLLEQMETSNQSRIRLNATRGLTDSSIMKKWKDNYNMDQKAVNSIRPELPNEHDEYDKLNPEGLEIKLIEIHKLNKKIQNLYQKYTSALAADEESRRQIQEDRRAIMTAGK
ncbi:MAG: hypothetical protein C4522_05760 [Desulfobacteraceae bacterium]|nr:MAG: hypothetical protein C4522_05760 [Desulfobacteraceae bacterium]